MELANVSDMQIRLIIHADISAFYYMYMSFEYFQILGLSLNPPERYIPG